MKLKSTLLGLIACIAICSTAMARINAPAPDSSQAAVANATPAADATATPVVADNAAPATTTTPAEAAPVVVATNATVTVTPAAAVDSTNTPVAPVDSTVVTNATVVAVTPAAPAAAPSSDAANAPQAHDPSAVIPLIVMDEVPLTDAIKNLARQASLNYMLDPKINYGVPDANGQVHQQPSVSLRWENLTADQALNAVLNNYNLVIIDDPKTRIARISIKDPAAPDPLVTKIIQLKYASASNMVVVINSSSILLDKRSKVTSDTRTSQLVIVSTEREMTTIDELVARLDTQTKQVLIEARIVETSKNPTSSKGIDWSGTLQAQHITFGNGNTTGTYNQTGLNNTGSTTAINTGTGSLPVGSSTAPYVTGNPTILSTANGPTANGTGATTGTDTSSGLTSLLTSTVGNGGLSLNTAKGLFPATAFLNADGASAVLSFLNNNFDATVLSTPRAVTLDNEEAILAVTTAQPIIQTTAGTQGSPGGSQVIYTNLGTILRVTPRISANNTINLRVIPEVSDVGAVVTKTVSGLTTQADSFDIRRIDTHVLIPSGNTLVMGGLVGDTRSKNNTKVPVLGDIPLLGNAFRSETKSQNKKNLIIFVTPTIVQSEDFQPTETSFLKTKVPNLKAADFGAWDSGEPQDWSKLIHSKKKTDDSDNDIPTTN
ncbi:MAG TPA: secretin N-terminal domain-containing protein [Verrucomicrobiae bacterium]|jgi:type II secretory pathway component GspD/PulD (secretin)|nr:secretin N-terminal domain-containing protein [Verrucomicrobiae bacterium]